MTSPLATSRKQSWLLVSFTFGDPAAPTIYRYTDFTSERQDVLGNTYTSMPNMEIKIPKITGMFNESPLLIVVELDAFFDRLSNSEPHSPVFVTVEEVITPDDPLVVTEQLMLFHGRLSKTTRNHQNISSQLALEAINYKSQLDVALSFPATQQCPWTFGGVGCGINATPLKEAGVITALNRRIITLPGLTLPTARYWHRGYMEIDGLRIGIRSWVDSDPNNFTMTREVPLSWLGMIATATPGCDKTIETCRATWANEAHFGGSGYMMPLHHPIYEDQ